MSARTEVEFYGGPVDGAVLMIDEDAAEWTVTAPALTTAQFMALEAGAPHGAGLPQAEHRYVRSTYVGRRTGKPIFTYSGVRRKA